ncbi:MAG TPA: FAD-dependent oxidoreductase [Acidimicrobiales bacterium]|nr:FAD-dependent oxidoreductase [Acidimicrobiales bacterium]
MTRVVVVGGGPTGLSAAMLLAARGMDVVVLDRDNPPPVDVEQAWDLWERRSVAQFHQVHLLLPGARALLEDQLPSVIDQLVAAGVGQFNVAEQLARNLPGGAGGVDFSRFFTRSTCRRPVLEFGFAAAARACPDVEIRYNCPVTELVLGPEVVRDVPHVIGVKTESGEVVTADLVLDVAGRRSPFSSLIEAAGGLRPPEHSEEYGFVYNTRYFQGLNQPEYRAPLLSPMGSISVLTVPGDRDHWSVTIYHSPKDKPMRKVRDPDVFDKVVRSMPHHAHWIDGEAVTEVNSMVSTANTTRQFVVDGRPCATGLLPIGDAWGFTNPSIGRGIFLGLNHAVALSDVVVANVGHPKELATAWDETTRREAVPWHDATVQFDRVRGPEVEALRLGEPDPHDPSDSSVAVARAFSSAAHYDPQVLAWSSELGSCLTQPSELFARPGVIERVLEVAGQNPTYVIPGPDRAQLEALLV